MAYTTINKSTDYFNTKLYTGNATSRSITGVGFQPDFTWIKNRDSGSLWHQLQDAVRGAGKNLYSNKTNAEADAAGAALTSFDSDGFTIGTGNGVNGSGNNIVSWNWKAANSSGSSNSDGSITSTVSANTTAGFSIVSYTGSSANSNIGTVGHGLSAAPKVLIVKDRDASSDWQVYHGSLDNNKILELNDSAAASTDANAWNNTAPTSSLFTVGDNSYTNANGRKFIAYCFAEKQGYSKFGSYTGNGNADGSFIFTGMKPSFLMLKRTDTTGSWQMYDNKRNPHNVVTNRLAADLSSEESTSGSADIDFLSNGFKMRNSIADWNASGGSYIYMSFAKASLVGSNNVPCTAR